MREDTVVDTVTVEKGAEVTMPSFDGCSYFQGWNADKNADPDDPSNIKGGDTLTIESNTVLYAICGRIA